MPGFTEQTRASLEMKYNEARMVFEKDSADPEAIIWLARRTAYLGNYKAAITLLTNGLELFPGDVRFYRHRGHRYITLRCNQSAIIDLIQAATMIQGKPDETEPDGLPNAQNIPTSTLQGNIWYHLALALYLEKDFKRSEQSWREALKVSQNPDMYIASAYWLYLTLRRAGKEKQAAELLEKVETGWQLIENFDYYDLLLLYKGFSNIDSLSEKAVSRGNGLSNATLGYGLGVFYLLRDQPGEAKEWFRKVLAGDQWSSFGYIAAEKEVFPD